MITLSDEQNNAINSIVDFYKTSEDIGFSLTGQAGTGKSTVINNLCNVLDSERIPYVLCAPTHKAALVVERLTNREAITLHKLLALTPNIEIFNLDFRELEFKCGFQLQFPYGGLVICDEASMVNDDLFKLLINKAKLYDCKVCFVSDKAQLSPVKSKTVSLVYDLKNSFSLTKIYRQSSENAIMPILQTLRETYIPKLDTVTGEYGSVFCTSEITEFLKWAKDGIKKSIQNSDILESKILAFTNARVEKYNSIIRQIVWDNNNQYNKLEILTGYENVEFNGTQFFNSMDYIIIGEPKRIDIYIPNFMSVPGFAIELYDSLTKTSEVVNIIDRDIPADYLNALCNKIEELRYCAINASQSGRRYSSKKWKEYYETVNSFTTPFDLTLDNRIIRKKSFDYGYACTVHKSQGSSFNNTYVDLKDINRCNEDEMKRQLQYVAFSRTRNDIFVLQ